MTTPNPGRRSLDEIRRDIIERGKIEAPGELVVGEGRGSSPPPLSPTQPALERKEKKPTERSEQLLEGRRSAAKRGLYQSGPTPYGYRRALSRESSEGRAVGLAPHPQESLVVQRIFREYLRLRSMKKLIELLDAEGLKPRRGKRWSRAGISWILKNDTYVGRVHFGKIKTRGVHEPIVSWIIFNKVNKLIRENDRRRDRRETATSSSFGTSQPESEQTASGECPDSRSP